MGSPCFVYTPPPLKGGRRVLPQIEKTPPIAGGLGVHSLGEGEKSEVVNKMVLIDGGKPVHYLIVVVLLLESRRNMMGIRQRQLGKTVIRGQFANGRRFKSILRHQDAAMLMEQLQFQHETMDCDDDDFPMWFSQSAWRGSRRRNRQK